MKEQSEYSKKLRDPRWQKKRLEILQQRGWKCEQCDDASNSLQVHHRYYISGRYPWEYPPFCYVCLCVDCHSQIRDLEEDRRSGKEPPFEAWEIGLNHFGGDVYDLAFQHICGEDLNKVKFQHANSRDALVG